MRDELGVSVGILREKLVELEVVEVVVLVDGEVVSCATEPVTAESKTMADPREYILLAFDHKI